MMNTHQLCHLARLAGRPGRPLEPGHAWALGARGGRLDVISGCVWVTREGELDDHVVEAGESLCITGPGEAVVEAWDEARPALVAWQPRRPGQRAVEALRSARDLAARLLLHNAVDAGRTAERAPVERARRPAQEAGGCATGAA